MPAKWLRLWRLLKQSGPLNKKVNFIGIGYVIGKETRTFFAEKRRDRDIGLNRKTMI